MYKRQVLDHRQESQLRIYKGLRTSILITTIYTIYAYAIMYVFGREAIRIFTQIHYAHVMLDTIILAYLSLALM